jgi:carnitine-CoA ligase
LSRVRLEQIEDRQLNRLLPHQAAVNGDAPWLMEDDAQLTFEDGHLRVKRYAAGFSARGIGPGDVVAVMMDSCTDYVLVILALIRVGAVSVPVNTAFRGEFLRRLLEQTKPACVVLDQAYASWLVAVLPDDAQPLLVVRGEADAVERRFAVGLADLAQCGHRVPAVDAHHDDVVTISYTSGTTGRSKGVVLTHHYWLTATEAMSSGRDIRESDVLHSCTPMFHAGAWLLNVYPSLVYGLPLGIDGRFSVRDYWARVRHYGATQLFTLGAMHMWLWDREPVPEETDNPARIWTAVPLSSDLVGPFRDRFGLDGVFSAYGQTEVMPAAVADVRRTWKPGSVGVAQPNVELRVVDEHDREVEAGRVGELVCRPRTPGSIFREYFDMPEASLDAFRNLWFHTGDLVRIDSDGEVFFVDRKADYVRRRGENISSLEVEEVMRMHEAVADVAVYGVPAQDSEDELKASIVAREGTTIDLLELARFCAENLPYFAVPRYLDVVDDLPRTPTGRVQKFLLRDAGIADTTWDAIAEGFTPKTPKPGEIDAGCSSCDDGKRFRLNVIAAMTRRHETDNPRRRWTP